MKLAGILVTSSALALVAATGAAAATFGPATGAIAVLSSPKVTTGPTSGTEVYNSAVSLFSTTGSLTGATGTGAVKGTLDFSNTVGTVIPDVVSGFMTFADSSGGTFTFDVASVETLGYSSIPHVATSITLYLLGTAGDAHLGLVNAPTSETLTVNQTGKSAYSASATISSPPSLGVPEAAAWVMMLMGFGMTGTALRSRKQTASA